jgi:enoyl-CoA hydratase/carnithine racemase
VGLSYFLPRVVGLSVAWELMLTGRFINARRALATGLFGSRSRQRPQNGRAHARTRDDGDSPPGLRLTKEGLAANVDAGSLEQALYLEDRNQTLCVNAGYVEEGARAFIEKRRPRFAEGA